MYIQLKGSQYELELHKTATRRLIAEKLINV